MTVTRPSLAAVLARHGLDRLHEGPGWRKVLCPYHAERVPSATANYDEGAFCCHACGMKGDVYALLMQHEGLTFPEALAVGEELHGDGADRPTRAPARKSGRKWKPPGRRGRA